MASKQDVWTTNTYSHCQKGLLSFNSMFYSELGGVKLFIKNDQSNKVLNNLLKL